MAVPRAGPRPIGADADAEARTTTDRRRRRRRARGGARRAPPIAGPPTPPTEARPSPAGSASFAAASTSSAPTNPYAAEEYAELRARLETLETQRATCATAIAGRASSSPSSTTLIADQFRTTFRALEAAFDARFEQLFGGGYAQLVADRPDGPRRDRRRDRRPAAGKKAQALAMLSGGERALTAVALLFAMLEVRPVPFCVLDEVDAALDEANVGRFADALRSLAAPDPVHRHHPQPRHDRGGRRPLRRDRRRRLGQPGHQPPARRGAGARRPGPRRARAGGADALLATARDEAGRPRPTPTRRCRARRQVEPGWEPDPADFEDPASTTGRRPEPATPSRRPSPSRARRPSRAPSPSPSRAPSADGAEPSPPYAAVRAGRARRRRRPPRARSTPASSGPAAASCPACAASSAAAADGPSWDEVEETLIAGDVGAALAMDVVERARRRRDPAGAEAAVRAELAALLVPRDPDWAPQPAGRRAAGRHPRRRRQRHRQDDDDRQARQPLRGGGPIGHPRRRRHVPRRRDRPAPDLGGPGRRAGRRPRARRRPRRGRLRRARCGGRPRRGPRHRRHRRPPPHQVEPHGRADQDPPDHRQAAARARARRRCSCSTRRPARTASPRRRRSTRRSGSPGSS